MGPPAMGYVTTQPQSCPSPDVLLTQQVTQEIGPAMTRHMWSSWDWQEQGQREKRSCTSRCPDVQDTTLSSWNLHRAHTCGCRECGLAQVDQAATAKTGVVGPKPQDLHSHLIHPTQKPKAGKDPLLTLHLAAETRHPGDGTPIPGTLCIS